MGRIRSIKPEFPHSESIGGLSRDARLLFIQLWTIVDDSGRTRAASRMLASLLYPYDDDAPKLMDGWLTELEQHGCIRRYEADTSKYLDIPNWLKHQKIDHPSASRLPEFREPSVNPRESSRALAPDLGPVPGPVEDRKGSDIRAVAKATRPSEIEGYFEEFKKAYPKRLGANPRAPALKRFIAAVKSGADPKLIIAAADRYRAEAERLNQVGTQFVAQMTKWLMESRWNDYGADASLPDGMPADLSPEQIEDWKNGWRPGMPSSHDLTRRLNAKPEGLADPEIEGPSAAILQDAEGDDGGTKERGWLPDYRERQSGMRGVEAVLPRSFAVGAAELPDAFAGRDTGDDCPRPLAVMVRR